jgi:hypothetical protein
MSKWNIGDRVQSVRRPGFYGTVVSVEGNLHVNPDHNRLKVKWDKVSKNSRGQWVTGILDELPIDLRSSRERISLPDKEKKLTGSEYGRILGNNRLKEIK